MVWVLVVGGSLGLGSGSGVGLVCTVWLMGGVVKSYQVSSSSHFYISRVRYFSSQYGEKDEW